MRPNIPSQAGNLRRCLSGVWRLCGRCVQSAACTSRLGGGHKQVRPGSARFLPTGAGAGLGGMRVGLADGHAAPPLHRPHPICLPAALVLQSKGDYWTCWQAYTTVTSHPEAAMRPAALCKASGKCRCGGMHCRVAPGASGVGAEQSHHLPHPTPPHLPSQLRLREQPGPGAVLHRRAQDGRDPPSCPARGRLHLLCDVRRCAEL